MPLWNFFKIIETGNFKYLFVVKDRFEYNELVIHDSSDSFYSDVWDSILDQFAKLENATGLTEQKMNRTKLLLTWSKYLEEQGMIKALYFRTIPEYIQKLRERGYWKTFTSNEHYWESLANASRRVHMHVTQMELLKAKQGKDEKPADSPFDSIIAWIMSNNIQVDDYITVKRYVEIKKIIHNRIKAIEKQNKRGHGRVRA